MSNDMNSVNLTGRLTREPELKFLQNGTAVCKFTIAVNRYGGKEKPEEVSFIDVTLWGKQGEAINAYLTKGKRVGVTGELRQERWEKDGQKQSKLAVTASSVYLLDSAKEGEARPQRAQTQASAAGPEEFSDEIPF